MKPLNTYLFLIILCISFSECFTLPTLSPGFGTGAIDLGGLLVHPVKSLTEIWITHEGGPNNAGATFYEPTSIPDGFYMLGSYSNSNIKTLPGWVLVGKDVSNDKTMLKPPIDYTRQIDSTTLAIAQNGAAYIWSPLCPLGYLAVGSLVTKSPTKPPLDKIRCVRYDFIVVQEKGDFVWGAKDAKGPNSFNLYSSKWDGGGNRKDPNVPTGAFSVQSHGSTTPSVSYLINLGATYTAMPNKAQIDEFLKQYSPVIYFHPNEEFFPSSVYWYFENGAMLYTKGKESDHEAVEANGSNLPLGGSNDGLYWLDMPQAWEVRDKLKKGDLPSANAYIHIKPTVGTTCTDIVLYIFYPYNGPGRVKVKFLFVKFEFDFKRIGEHIGDWEHITLRVNNFDGKLKSVYLSQHGKGVWVDAADLEYEKGKPVVYASRHGHASYAKSGMNLLGSGIITLRNDAAKGRPFDTGKSYTIISADYLTPPIVEPNWLNFARKWGPELFYDISDELRSIGKFVPSFLRKKYNKLLDKLPPEIMGQEGPIGPKWKDSWDGDEKA